MYSSFKIFQGWEFFPKQNLPPITDLSNHWGGPASGKRTDSFTAMTTLCLSPKGDDSWHAALQYTLPKTNIST